MCWDLNANNRNNMFYVGDFGYIMHYNGASYKELTVNAGNSVSYSSVDFQSGLVAIAGADWSTIKGIVVRGIQLTN